MKLKLRFQLFILIISLSSCQPIVSDCFSDSEYVFLDLSVSFDEANLACIKEGANLAEITTLEENEFVGTFLKDISNFNAYISHRVLNNESTSNPLNYQSSSVRFGDDGNNFATIVEEFPWQPGRPRDVGNNESCVEIRDENGGYNNVACNLLKPAMCERSCSLIENESEILRIISFFLGVLSLILVLI